MQPSDTGEPVRVPGETATPDDLVRPRPAAAGPRRALVTNDDGIDSEGLRRLALAAGAAGLDVVVAAPLTDSSGASASLSALRADGRVVIEERALDGVEGPVFGVGAVPGFIALVATRGAFGPPPDVVLSGVNWGLNTGRDVLHSGTVGAALTGSAHGLRTAAFSVDIGATAVGAAAPDASGAPVVHWDTVHEVACEVIGWLAAFDAAVVLNVNVPNVAAGELRGILRADLATFGAVQTNVAEVGRGFLRLEVAEVDVRNEPASDAALVRAGHATVTALQPFCEARDVPLPVPPVDAVVSGTPES